MTELQGHEDRVEIGADGGVFVRSRTEGLHGRSRVGGSAPSLCQRARCYQSRPWDLDRFASGVLFGFALLAVFVTLSAQVGAGRPAFAAVCALMMLALALRFPPAPPGA